MKKLYSKRNILFGSAICIALAITAMAFQDSTIINKHSKQALLDTVPKNHNNDIDIELNLKDLDQTIKKSLEMAEKVMKEIDWNKISKQVEQSMKQIDMAKLQMVIDKSMKAIDWEKMKSEIKRSMKEIDMSKMKIEMEKEMKNAMKGINSEEMRKSMEEIKKLNFDELKKEMKNLKKEMELNKDHFKLEMDKAKIEMNNAKLEMLKAKTGLSELKEMTTEMEKDGILNKKESNTIEYKNKELLINGKKQSPEVTGKYRKYFKGDNFKFKFSEEN